MFAETPTDVGAHVPFGGEWFAPRRDEDKMKFYISSFQEHFLFIGHKANKVHSRTQGTRTHKKLYMFTPAPRNKKPNTTFVCQPVVREFVRWSLWGGCSTLRP